MHALVATVVHHPEDARILHRQIRALLDAGHSVTYVAPFRECGVTPWSELRSVDVPRSSGRERLASLRAARAVLAEQAPLADLLLFHDPELLMALPSRRPVTVWDVHEDTAAALLTKAWVPRALRRPLGTVVRSFERHAERRMRLMLAEEGYRSRFRLEHPVVPNTTEVPEFPAREPGDDRIVYLGQVSEARGARELVELGRMLRPHGVRLEVIGGADAGVRPLLREAQQEDVLHWYGFVPNDRALRICAGAMAGLSLLHDTPNYRHSMPTKVVEYMAHGLPVVTTPNPMAQELVTGRPEGPSGLVVPFGDVSAAAESVLRLRRDAELRRNLARTGHRIARTSFHWPVQARLFVKRLEAWADEASGGPLAVVPPPRSRQRTPVRD
ncbi:MULTISPECIES: glycosyltransferase [Nocardiopsis]|uniref:Glycosyl transferase group 1 n=1 Tax=Nocardiopsis dassonvillei (strain ATCC 23218 / DSM 43111 / CIP 107115 / JCM 7437 / KCTC 9190 / NBRC 14626 / NCTC 10488 / NRRL B-5397 / IMRU 509) TaxID=446468 RepID=D7B6G3_NOCDD|nr:glycosyltransferase [Nocardiopsis dassonvillei]ADH69250.1 glycosyl transferase group 1 [Nocardiopsis dassonvillei subsp. dassonvillei DSM 43111]NKY80655.1 glycosyltransferase family 4 protein [Nocardiopsis dassonvillei]VEI89759.1 colanic acid biosynthesis glycosyltransferase WcaL [Nocardiopsis dassonvillei]